MLPFVYLLWPRQDWMYYMDEIETTDTGSYTPSEVETMEPWFFDKTMLFTCSPKDELQANSKKDVWICNQNTFVDGFGCFGANSFEPVLQLHEKKQTTGEKFIRKPIWIPMVWPLQWAGPKAPFWRLSLEDKRLLQVVIKSWHLSKRRIIKSKSKNIPITSWMAMERERDTINFTPCLTSFNHCKIRRDSKTSRWRTRAPSLVLSVLGSILGRQHQDVIQNSLVKLEKTIYRIYRIWNEIWKQSICRIYQNLRAVLNAYRIYRQK